MDQTDIRRLECLSFNAWPALRTTLRDGWVLRFAEGHTKRANSASALWPGAGPLAARVDAFEADYRRAGLTPIFRLTPLAEPGLDDTLAARGYSRFDESLVMTRDLSRTAARGAPGVELEPNPDAGWLDDLARAACAGARETAILARMLAGLVPRAAFVRVKENAAARAFAMGALEDGHLGIFEVLTVPEARGRGLARRAIEALFAWAGANGATRAYLQVTDDNAAARALYAYLGFATAYRYHYRRAP
ncbi:MAG: GNAT family N-acetyltransferase [Tagaea sp.]|nr:GNAT family N-acetyltransferase [Tagaea sp.]